MNTLTSRWNLADAASAYDEAGPQLHPCYHAVQTAVLAAVPPAATRVVDLGGGSGRLVERLLDESPAASATVVEPSDRFLGLASGRLRRFGVRARLVNRRAEQPWGELLAPPDAIVSTSALHHLTGAEKSRAFAECHAALKPGGVFINGDEYRPPSDAAYRRLLEDWRDHMRSMIAAELVPEPCGPLVDRWEERNLIGFGGPRDSGDDCHETIEEQIARLYGAGFTQVDVTFRDRLWAVLVATK